MANPPPISKAPTPPDAGKQGPPFIVTNVKPRLIGIAGLNIGPGQSAEIPPEHVEGVKASSVFKARFLVEGTPALPASTPIDITRLDVEKAKKLIAVEDDPSVLTAWIDADKRAEVIRALQDRVRQL